MEIVLRLCVLLLRGDEAGYRCLHPLQEILQPEGKARFKGVLNGIERMANRLKIPVIVKEVGCGISEEVAQKLVNAGVACIDIAGAGGTSWAGIESYRVNDESLAQLFWDCTLHFLF